MAMFWSSRALKSIRPAILAKGLGKAEAYRELANRAKTEAELRDFAESELIAAHRFFKTDGQEWARRSAIAATIFEEIGRTDSSQLRKPRRPK